MKSIKMALLAGAAVAVTGAAAHADELQDLKAQIEALNTRVAAMETAPAVPAGYQLLAISKGEALQVPGLEQSNQERFTQGDRATIISVLPTADAPAGTTISWSGYARAGIVYNGQDLSVEQTRYTRQNVDSDWVRAEDGKTKKSDDSDDWDVKARGQLRVVATTDTAVGEVGVELKLRADFQGNGNSDIYMKTAWGYWSMTPELTLGGGYTGSLGNIGYGYDGACTCYYTDNSDVGFDPGDTTQMRLSYASGPFSAAVAIEDASIVKNGEEKYNGNNLGAAGEIKYSGDTFSGEISGLYRSTDNSSYDVTDPAKRVNYASDVDGLWQVGAGVGFNLGSIASLSLAAAVGEGPWQTVNDSTGLIENNLNINNQWWGISGLISANLSDTVHAEFGAGYKNRSGDNIKNVSVLGDYDADPDNAKTRANWNYGGFDYDTYSFLGGLYYNPVDQLTIGVEGEWATASFDVTRTGADDGDAADLRDKYSIDQDTWTVDLVSVWRF